METPFNTFFVRWSPHILCVCVFFWRIVFTLYSLLVFRWDNPMSSQDRPVYSLNVGRAAYFFLVDHGPFLATEIFFLVDHNHFLVDHEHCFGRPRAFLWSTTSISLVDRDNLLCSYSVDQGKRYLRWRRCKLANGTALDTLSAPLP